MYGEHQETVVSADEPHSWTYRITEFHGPLAALLDKIEAEFLFSATGTGTRITWPTTCLRGHVSPRRRCRPAVGSGGRRAADARGIVELAGPLTGHGLANHKRVIREVVNSLNYCKS